MDLIIEKYCMLYSQDIAQRVGLNAKYLQNALTFSVLLNPLFGLEQRIVGLGLLTKEQFDRAKRGMYFLNFMPPQTEFISTFHFIVACCLIEPIQVVQDLLDRKNPPTCANDDNDDDEDDDDGYVPQNSNCN